MYTAYCSPSLIKERLGNGDRIPIILYELNPLRDPNYRINHYRNDFNEISDRTLPYLKKYNNLKKKKNRKAKTAGKTKSLYNSIYSNYVLRVNFDRPREIKNEDGVIISRHFRSLYINAREYPKSTIRSFRFDKRPSKRKINFNDIINRNKNYNGTFFSTEVKFNSNKNYKNFNNVKNENRISSYEYHNDKFSKTIYSTKYNNFLIEQNRNKFTNNIENTKNSNIISSKNLYHGNHSHTKIAPLLFKSNY